LIQLLNNYLDLMDKEFGDALKSMFAGQILDYGMFSLADQVPADATDQLLRSAIGSRFNPETLGSVAHPPGPRPAAHVQRWPPVRFLRRMVHAFAAVRTCLEEVSGADADDSLALSELQRNSGRSGAVAASEPAGAMDVADQSSSPVFNAQHFEQDTLELILNMAMSSALSALEASLQSSWANYALFF
jgi:hypothetical protein